MKPLEPYLLNLRLPSTKKIGGVPVAHRQTCPRCGRALVNLYKHGRYWACKKCWDEITATFAERMKKPLTPDELRRLKGQRIWVQPPENPEYGRWAKVEGVSEDGEALFLENDFTCHEYGRVWQAFLVEQSETQKEEHA